jgi:hypothetical protein
MHTARDPADRPRGRRRIRRPSGPPGPVPGMLHVREAGFRPAAVAAGGAVPKFALSAVATYAPPRRAHHHKPAGGMPTPECRGRPPAVHVEGGESRGPAPALATTVPDFFLIFVCYRGSQAGPVSRTLLAGHTQQGSRPCRRRAVAIPKRRHVCARCHRKKTDLQAGVLCSDGTLVSAYGLMLLLVAGRRR